MKKHNVYGMGNALVDMEIEVPDAFLQEMEIEKGLMTLIDENRQNELLEKIPTEPHKRSCGGSAANSIIAVSQLGGKSFYSCKVASDETGDFYFSDLKANGVETNLEGGREEGVTGKCLVFISPDAERTMNSFLGITGSYSLNELVEEELKQSEYLYIEGYLVTNDDAKAAVRKARQIAKENGVKISMTFSDPSMVNYFKEGLIEMIDDGVDLLFCNEEEATTFTDTKSAEEAAAKLKKYAKAFVITCGKNGAYIFDGDKEIRVSSPEVKPIDTNGAGDLFAGSFLYAITNGHDYEKAGVLAANASSKLVTQFGARLETDQILKVKSEIL